MTRMPQTLKTLFKQSNQGLHTPSLGHRHDEVITERQSEPSHFVKRISSYHPSLTNTVGRCKHFCMSMQNTTTTSLPLQRPHRLPQFSSQLDSAVCLSSSSHLQKDRKKAHVNQNCKTRSKLHPLTKKHLRNTNSNLASRPPRSQENAGHLVGYSSQKKKANIKVWYFLFMQKSCLQKKGRIKHQKSISLLRAPKNLFRHQMTDIPLL